MSYYLTKTLGFFVSPYALALVSLALALWTLRKGRPRATGGLVAAALVLLVVPALPLVSDTLLWDLETAYPALRANEYPTADAIVVLGGTTPPVLGPRREPQEDGSRLLQAARLFRAGRAPLVVVSGGVPYSGADGRERTEADDMHDILLDMAVPAKALRRERASRNTRENAVHTARLLAAENKRSILLVTSAFHMRRAVAAFRDQGLEVTPVPAAFLSGQARPDGRRFLPNAASLHRSATALREHVGYLAGRVLPAAS